MAISNYGELKQAVADWLIRTDLDQLTPTAVTMAISGLNNILRSPYMVANADIVIGAATRKGTCPADMLEPIYVQVKTDEDYPLEHVEVPRLITLRRSMLRAQGALRFFAIVGTSIEVSPTPATSTTLDMAYYQAIPAFTNDASTNWVLTHNPDIMLYMTLFYMTQFMDDGTQQALFSNALMKQLIAAVTQNAKVTMDRNGSVSLAAVQPAAAA